MYNVFFITSENNVENIIYIRRCISILYYTEDMRKNSSGFTIVELLIVIVVIGILAVIVIVAYSGVQNRANDAAIATDKHTFTNQIELFRATSPTNTYPADTTDLAQLKLRLNPSVYAASPTVGANLLYCTTNDKLNYVLLVYSKTGVMSYISNTGSGVFNGSNNWSSNNYQGRCANVLPGSASNAYAGYDSSSPTPWQSWSGAQ